MVRPAVTTVSGGSTGTVVRHRHSEPDGDPDGADDARVPSDDDYPGRGHGQAALDADAGGIDALRDLRAELAGRSTVLVLARARADLRLILARTGLADGLPVYRSVRGTIAAYRRTPEEQ